MLNKKLTIIPIIIAAFAIGSFSIYSGSQDITAHVSGTSYDHSFDELVEKAEYAIIGTVEKVTPVRVDMPKESDEDRVYTDVLINVKDDMYDRYSDKQISVRIMGGEVDSYKMTTDFEPEFIEGKEVFLFVSGVSEGYTYNGHHYVVGHNQGTFDVIGEQLKNQRSGETMQKSELVSLKSKLGSN